jgi:hypothetical protein
MTMTARQTRPGGARILAVALGLAAGSVATAGESAEVMVYSARAHYGQEPAMEAFTRKTEASAASPARSSSA